MLRTDHYPSDASTQLLVNNAREIISGYSAQEYSKDSDSLFFTPAEEFFHCLDELANRGEYSKVYRLVNELTEKKKLTYRNDTWELKQFLFRNEDRSFFAKLLLRFILRTEYKMAEGTERRFRIKEFITGEYSHLTGPDTHTTVKSEMDIVTLIREIPTINVEPIFYRVIDSILAECYHDDLEAQKKRHEEIIKAVAGYDIVKDYMVEADARRQEHRHERQEKRNH